jgi:formiminotetrahydrofolate cyclodeaminase
MKIKEFSMLKDQKLEKLLSDIASNSPTPGGGTVAGISGAIAASLVLMVCNLTIGKKKYQTVEDEIKKNLKDAEKLQQEFTLLAQRDTEVFNDVMEAYKLPHETEEDKNTRKTAVEEALKKASLVPMDVLRRCETMACLCRTVALKGNENSISDAGVAVLLTHAAAQSACLNILINLSTISDEDFIGKLKTEQEHVLKTVKDLTEETMQIVHSKL